MLLNSLEWVVMPIFQVVHAIDTFPFVYQGIIGSLGLLVEIDINKRLLVDSGAKSEMRQTDDRVIELCFGESQSGYLPYLIQESF